MRRQLDALRLATEESSPIAPAAGGRDSAANSNSYNDQVSSEVAMDGYSARYGEPEKYQELFRLGYIAGYKEGWDYNAGRYCATCAR